MAFVMSESTGALDRYFGRTIENLRAIGAGFAADHSAKAEAVSEAHRALTSELREALLCDPQRKVRVPYFSESNAPTMTAAEVVADLLSGKNGEERLHDLLRILGDAAQGKDVRLVATLLIGVLSAQHATLHCEDAVAAE